MYVSKTADAHGLNAASPSMLAQRLLLAGIYFQETCKNKFKIAWEGLREEEAEVRQTLTL